MNQKKATDEQVINAYQKHGNVWKVGKELGMCGQSIHERLKRLNVKTEGRGKQITSQETNIAKHYYETTPDHLFRRDALLAMLPPGTTISRLEHIVTKAGIGKQRSTMSDVQRNELSRARTGIKPPHDGFSGFRHTEASKEKISIASKAKWNNPNFKSNTPDGRERLAERARINGAKAVSSHNVYSRCKRGYYNIPGRGEVYFRSKWEANYALYLQFLVNNGQIKSWDYEARTFEFPVKRGIRFYTPDFLIIALDDTEEHHEVKGWMDKKSKTKIRRMAIHHPNVKFIVIGQTEYKRLQQYAALLKWY